MTIEGGKRHLIKVDKSDFSDARTEEHCSNPGANTAAADDDYEGLADFAEAVFAEKGAVAGELLED